MPPFERVWPGAGLAFNQPPGSSNLTQLDVNVSKSINGDEGGAWAPSAEPIAIGGTKGLWVAAPFRADDATLLRVRTGGALTLDTGSTTLVNGAVNFTGISTPVFFGLVSFAPSSTLNAEAGSTVKLAGITSIPNGGVLSTSGTGTINLGGNTNQQGAYAKVGVAATVAERVIEIDRTELAVTVSTEADVWYVQTPTAAGTTVYTVKSTSPVPPEGVTLEIVVYGITIGKTIEIHRENGIKIATFQTGYGAVRLRFIANSWRLMFISGDSATIDSA